ncbi:hypothetical protein TNCV_890971 [Trichonephila clavipes]|nr:hypothetical protein TNCV_890971 [Trichonephila clavipes]
MGGNEKPGMKENVSNQENSPAERGGGTCPRTLYRCRAPAGREERRKAVRTAERSKSKHAGHLARELRNHPQTGKVLTVECCGKSCVNVCTSTVRGQIPEGPQRGKIPC